MAREVSVPIKYCLHISEFKWKNKVDIGIIFYGKFVSTLFSMDDLYYQALMYANTFSSLEHENYIYTKEVHQRFMADGWAVPLTHYSGMTVFLLRENERISLCSYAVLK